MLRGLINIAQLAIAESIEHSDEAEEVINRAEQSSDNLSENRIGQRLEDIRPSSRNRSARLDALYARGQEITGLRRITRNSTSMTSGFQTSDLIIIAARPSMGKTAFAMNIAENAAVAGTAKSSRVFSLEMSKEALLMRMLCSRSQVDSHKLRTGFLASEDMEQADARHGAADAGSDLHRRHARHLGDRDARQGAPPASSRKARLDLIVVDYLQLMSAVPTAASALRTARRKFRPSRAD